MPDFLQEIEDLAIDVKRHLYSAYDMPSKDRVRAALGALDYLLMRLEKLRGEGACGVGVNVHYETADRK